MPQSVIELGEKIHVITRRNFPEEVRRHYAGTVEAVSGAIIRTHGYTFVFNPTALEYRRRPEVRTRLFGIADGQHIINVLPADVVVDELRYLTLEGRLMVTDGRRFRLDVNEFGATS